MKNADESRALKGEIPVLFEKLDISSLSLTPKEAFVLSRVNGSTSVEQIASISGLPLEEVARIFSRLKDAGAVQMKAAAVTKTPGKGKTKSILEQLEEDESYDTLSAIPREFRKEILLKEGDIANETHYQVLGVEKDASLEKIKKAYFNLTKEYHPDRFFGKELGIYKKKMEKIFERIGEAHKVLSDEYRRKDYDRKLTPKTSAHGSSGAREEKTPPKTLIERLAEAKRYYSLGELEFKKGNHSSAFSYFKLASVYDPSTKLYAEAVMKVKPKLDRKRAKVMLEEAGAAEQKGQHASALKLAEEAFVLEPNSPEANYLLARLLLLNGDDAERAKGLCLKALETMGDRADARITMGKIFKICGLEKNAAREFKLALKLDKENKTARIELEELGE